jgi:hypothetical protein
MLFLGVESGKSIKFNIFYCFYTFFVMCCLTFTRARSKNKTRRRRKKLRIITTPTLFSSVPKSTVCILKYTQIYNILTRTHGPRTEYDGMEDVCWLFLEFSSRVYGALYSNLKCLTEQNSNKNLSELFEYDARQGVGLCQEKWH